MSSPSPTSNIDLKIKLLNLKKPIVRLFWKENKEEGPEFADEYFLPEVAIKLIIERMKQGADKNIEGYFQNVKRQSKKQEERIAKFVAQQKKYG